VADDGQIFGISAEAAQVAKIAAAGGFGAWVTVYLRHPGTIVKVLVMVSIGVGIATIFAEPLAQWLGLSGVQSGAVLGLIGKAMAEGLLNAIEKADFSGWLPSKKSQGD
jgi:predicted alpha/beta hydrolase